jgi:hypothetical protein
MATIVRGVFLLLAVLVVTSQGQTSFSPCDVNHDGSTTVADAQSVINQALGLAQAVNDLNNDGSVNVVDVQVVINAALNLGCLTGVPPLTVTGFNPQSGPIGTLVTVTGSNFGTAPKGSMPQVTLSMQGGGTIAAPTATFTATAISFVIPAGAATGPVTVTVGTQSATSSASLGIAAPSNFTLAVSPANSNVIQGDNHLCDFSQQQQRI